MKKSELLLKLKSVEPISEEQKKSIVCSLIGHSRIVSACFGYIHCGRCDTQIGDTLGGAYNASENVVIGPKCDKCVENMKKMTWKDKFLVEDPFA